MDNKLKVHIPVCEVPYDLYNLNEYEESIRTNGVVVLKNTFSEEHLDELSAEFDQNWEEVKKRIDHESCPKSPGIYLDSGVPKTYLNQSVWTLEDGSFVLDLARGRHDFTFGMDKGVFAEPRFFNNPLISALVWRLLKCDWTHYNGALPSYSSVADDSAQVAGSDHGPGHRDTYSLFGCEEQDQGLPPFYLTLIVPLQEVTEDLGPTEFVLGSHKTAWETALKDGKDGLKHVLATSKRGDCVLFDGRMIHRGTPCRSAQPRRAVYTVFHKKWYSDYVDNQFPQCSNKHGAPRDAVLPSGFQVPLDITHPSGGEPAWRFSVSVPIAKGDIIWIAGQGDSLVFDSRELIELYLEKLSDLEIRDASKVTYQTQEGKIVLRKDFSTLMPEESNDTLANITVDEKGNWIATKDIKKDSNIFISTRKLG